MVFEYCNGDLSQYIQMLLNKARENAKLIPQPVGKLIHPENGMQIKQVLYHILLGVHAAHVNRVIHRDLKPANILLKDGLWKIADFGIARSFCVPQRPLSNEVVTIWYRAPELIYGSEDYSLPVDIWSIGCIFYELCNLMPLFMGENPLQIAKLFNDRLGTPTEKEWPGCRNLPLFT